MILCSTLLLLLEVTASDNFILLDDELYELERILNLPDQLLLNIILGKEEIPANLYSETLKNLISISYEWS